MNPPPPTDLPHGSSAAPSPSGPGATRRLTGQVGWWLLRLVLGGAAVLTGWLLGGPLALFGLGGVALVLALTLVGVAALGWRAAGLPLALTAAALALSATLVAAQPARLDRSAGLLWAQPRTAEALKDGSPYVRGHGSVLLDLRRTNLSRGSVTDVRVTSGDGRIFVALPYRRCVAVSITFRQTWLPDGFGSLALIGAEGLGVVEPDGVWGGTNLFERPDRPGPEQFSNLEAYGRNVAPTISTAPASAGSPTWRWNRPVDEPAAPLLRLHLEAAQQIFVRDYPDGAGPAFLAGDPGQPEAMGTGEQLADATWPAALRLPRSPAELTTDGAWRERARGADARVRDRRWRTWAKQWVISAARNANLAAGTCASRETRAKYWRSVEIDDASSSLIRVIAVNALGDVRYFRALGTEYVDPASLRTDPDPPSAFADLSVDANQLEAR